MTGLLPSTAERALARELGAIRAELETVKAGSRATQLGHSSLLAPLVIRDPGDGSVLGSLGQHGDGGVAFVPTGGPPPPQPTAPYPTPTISGGSIAWDGRFAGDAPRPTNFAHVAVHVSGAGETFISGPSNLVGVLTGAGSLPVGPLVGPQWVRFVGYSTSTPPVTGPASVTATFEPAQVVSTELLDGIVSEVKLADEAVARAKVKTAAIGSAQIGGQAVTLAALASGAVDATVLAASAVTVPAIAPLAVTGPALAAGSVVAGKIAANAVTTGTVDANVITGVQVIADAIGASELAAGSVIAGKVAASAITATELAANSVGADQIAAASIQATALAAGSVTAAALAAGSVTAGALAANSITAGAILAGSITGDKFEAVLVLTKRMVAGNPSGTRAEVNEDGFEAWNGTLKTFDVDALSGSVTVIGELSTGVTGERVRILTSGSIQFYGATGSDFGEVTAVGTGGLWLRPRAPVADAQGYLLVDPDNVYIGHGPPGGTATSHFMAKYNNVDIRSPVIGFRVERRFPPDHSFPRIVFIQQNPAGSDIPSNYIHFYAKGIDGQPGTLGEHQIHWYAQDTGLLGMFGQPGLYVSAYDTGVTRPIVASAFSVSSSESVKRTLRTIDDSDDAIFGTFAGARAKRWRYKRPGDLVDDNDPTGPRLPPRIYPPKVRARRRIPGTPDDGPEDEIFEYVDTPDPAPEPPEPEHIFPTAEELEANRPELVLTTPDGTKLVDIRDMTGFLWEAVTRIIDRVKRLDNRLVLDARSGPAPNIPAGAGGVMWSQNGQLWWMPQGSSTPQQIRTV